MSFTFDMAGFVMIWAEEGCGIAVVVRLAVGHR